MLNINNKFEIGQEVYLIRKVKIKNPCPACNGEGNKIIDGNKFYCSKCDGEGYLRYEEKKEYQVVGLVTISLVKSITQLQGKELIPQTVVTYNASNENGTYTIKEIPEHHLFTNGEEAIKACDDLNMFVRYDEYGEKLLKEMEEQNG